MKVIYPGPKVTGADRTRSRYFGAYGVELMVGENDVPDGVATQLLRDGVAAKPAPHVEAPRRRGFRREQPAPTPDEKE